MEIVGQVSHSFHQCTVEISYKMFLIGADITQARSVFIFWSIWACKNIYWGRLLMIVVLRI
jgi:hypothetical protein